MLEGFDTEVGNLVSGGVVEQPQPPPMVLGGRAKSLNNFREYRSTSKHFNVTDVDDIWGIESVTHICI